MVTFPPLGEVREWDEGEWEEGAWEEGEWEEGGRRDLLRDHMFPFPCLSPLFPVLPLLGDGLPRFSNRTPYNFGEDRCSGTVSRSCT